MHFYKMFEDETNKPHHCRVKNDVKIVNSYCLCAKSSPFLYYVWHFCIINDISVLCMTFLYYVWPFSIMYDISVLYIWHFCIMNDNFVVQFCICSWLMCVKYRTTQSLLLVRITRLEMLFKVIITAWSLLGITSLLK